METASARDHVEGSSAFKTSYKEWKRKIPTAIACDFSPFKTSYKEWKRVVPKLFHVDFSLSKPPIRNGNSKKSRGYGLTQSAF